MGLELNELLGERTIIAMFGEKPIEVTYRLGERTTAKLDASTAFTNPVADTVVDLVVAWDLVDQGEPVPITKDIVDEKIPVPVLRCIVSAIIGDDGRGEVQSSSDGT